MVRQFSIYCAFLFFGDRFAILGTLLWNLGTFGGQMVWSKTRILQELRRLHKTGKDLSYNGLAKTMQPLVSAAAYHYGSYRGAIEQAGIDYAEVVRRPRWTKPRIISLIKQAKRDGSDLHWSAVTKRRDELGKAAFASLQPRLFGRWDRALQASGLDADDVSRYRRWTRTSIVFDLKARSRQRAAEQRGHPGGRPRPARRGSAAFWILRWRPAGGPVGSHPCPPSPGVDQGQRDERNQIRPKNRHRFGRQQRPPPDAGIVRGGGAALRQLHRRKGSRGGEIHAQKKKATKNVVV